MTTHLGNNVDLVDHNGTTVGLMLDGVLVTKTAAQINALTPPPAIGATIVDITNTATGDEIATAVNAIIARLKAANIIS